MDPLHGNSGSPGIVTVYKCAECQLHEMRKEPIKAGCDICQAYKVKAIHVYEVDPGKTNLAQMLKDIDRWIPRLSGDEEEKSRKVARENELFWRGKFYLKIYHIHSNPQDVILIFIGCAPIRPGHTVLTEATGGNEADHPALRR